MHAVGSLAWRILFSLTFMSHLYKEIFCESILHNAYNGLEQNISPNQMQQMVTEYSKEQILNRLGLSQTPNSLELIPGPDTNAGTFSTVGADGPESKQQSMNAMFQMSKEEFLRNMLSARIRRDSAGRKEASQRCQKHELYVNFTTLGWNKDFVRPEGYMANYCAGDCTLPLTDVKATHHATIKGLLHSKYPNIPKPCCVPTKLSPINILYWLDSKLEKGTLTDMVVDECGCL